MSLAEYEYEVHSSVDVFEDLGHVGERLKSMAESIQLVDKNELKKQIHNLYFNTEYLEACTSCNGRDHNVSKVKAAVQAKEPIAYELVK